MEKADLWASGLLLAFVLIFTLVYLARVLLKGRAAHQRVEKDQGSALLGKPAMEMAHWLFGPLAVFLSKLGLTPNGASYFSLFFAATAVWPLSHGYFGLGAALAFLSSIFDLVDGAIARYRNMESDAGEVLDAAVDRYGEFLFLAGLAVFFRGNVVLLSLVLVNILGTFMVSYSTAKAEALRIDPPRGAMRRPERAFYMLIGAALSPAFSAIMPLSQNLPPVIYAELPLLAALALVGVVANFSAVNRLRAVALKIRQREAQQKKEYAKTDPT